MSLTHADALATKADLKEMYERIYPYLGGESNYSTDEKIVGTWLDGSNLYQKTYIQQAPNSTKVSIPLPTNYDIAWIVDGFYLMSDSTGTIPLNLWMSSSVFTQAWTDYDTDEISAFNKMGGSATIYVTIRYTKSST